MTPSKVDKEAVEALMDDSVLSLGAVHLAEGMDTVTQAPLQLSVSHEVDQKDRERERERDEEEHQSQGCDPPHRALLVISPRTQCTLVLSTMH